MAAHVYVLRRLSRGSLALCTYTWELVYGGRIFQCHGRNWKWRAKLAPPQAKLASSAAGDGSQQQLSVPKHEVKVQIEPTLEELENEEPWMQEEIKAYYRGRKRLAKMMGRDPESFTEQDVKDSLRYLLPTRLFERDARPFLKHPSEIFPKRAESKFDAATGRPLEAAFYTGFPGYHNLVYQIFQHRNQLEEAERRTAVDSTHACSHQETSGAQTEGEEGSGVETEGGGGSGVETAGEEGSGEGEAVTVTSKDEGESTARVKRIPKNWINKDKMANVLAEGITDEQYATLISRLQQLSDHPLSSDVAEFLDQYRRPIAAHQSLTTIPPLRQGGEEAQAVGRRKTSCAVVRLRRGDGQVLVNGRPFINYFPRVEDRQQILYPLTLTGLLGEFNIIATVHGGGLTGQAGAIRLGISKALLSFPGSHSDQLEQEGLLVRDPRMVERKKPGQKKARKKFAWVKR